MVFIFYLSLLFSLNIPSVGTTVWEYSSDCLPVDLPASFVDPDRIASEFISSSRIIRYQKKGKQEDERVHTCLFCLHRVHTCTCIFSAHRLQFCTNTREGTSS